MTEEEAFEEWSDTWPDTEDWHGPRFWKIWQAACAWQREQMAGIINSDATQPMLREES
jgi:hypothetical protein